MQEFDLEEARWRYPLPDGVEDARVNRAQLAIALATSENTLTKWLAQGLPVLEEGGNGREYAFQLSDCFAWRMARDERLRAERAAADKAAHQLALQFRNPDDEEDAPRLTAREIAEESDAEVRRLKAAQLRGDLVRVDRMIELLEDLFAAFRNSVTTLPDFAEVEFGLGPDEVDKMQKRCDAFLDQMRELIERQVGIPTGEMRRLATDTAVG